MNDIRNAQGLGISGKILLVFSSYLFMCGDKNKFHFVTGELIFILTNVE